MPIEISKNGGFVATGDGVRLYQMLAQRSALKLEILGLRHSSGRSIYAHIKRTYGLKGSKQKVLEQFSALCDEASSKVQRTTREE